MNHLEFDVKLLHYIILLHSITIKKMSKYLLDRPHTKLGKTKIKHGNVTKMCKF